ncbi:ATPase, partial [Streptomyces sp. SID7804]|nr:ATPase [Streptomyces sp. SID7804]
GGRHRAPVFALALAELLRDAGHQVTVHHRDLDKNVVQR